MRSNSLKQSSIAHLRLHTNHSKKNNKNNLEEQPSSEVSLQKQTNPQEVQWLNRILNELKNYQNQANNPNQHVQKKQPSKESCEDKVKQDSDHRGRGIKKIKIAIIDPKESKQPVSKKLAISSCKNATSAKIKPKMHKKPLSQSVPKRQKQNDTQVSKGSKNCISRHSHQKVLVQQLYTDPFLKQPQNSLDSSLWKKDSDTSTNNKNCGRPNLANKSVGRIVRNSPATRTNQTSLDSFKQQSQEIKKVEEPVYQPKFKSPKNDKKIYLKLQTDKLAEYLALSKTQKVKQESQDAVKSQNIFVQISEEDHRKSNEEDKSKINNEQLQIVTQKKQENKQVSFNTDLQIKLQTPLKNNKPEIQRSQSNEGKSQQRKLNNKIQRKNEEQISKEKLWNTSNQRSSYALYKEMKSYRTSIQPKQYNHVRKGSSIYQSKGIQEIKRSYLNSQKIQSIRKKHQKLFTLHQIQSQSDRSSPTLTTDELNKTLFVKKQQEQKPNQQKKAIISQKETPCQNILQKSMTAMMSLKRQIKGPQTIKQQKTTASPVPQAPCKIQNNNFVHETDAVLKNLFELLDPQQTGLITSSSSSECLTQQLKLLFSSVFNQLKTLQVLLSKPTAHNHSAIKIQMNFLQSQG